MTIYQIVSQNGIIHYMFSNFLFIKCDKNSIIQSNKMKIVKNTSLLGEITTIINNILLVNLT